MRVLAFAGLILAASVSLPAATFTVTTTADSGAGSLRQAILDANANAGLDTIAFNIPGAGVHTITPTSDFAQITDAVLIDGYTQPGASVNADPVGSNAVLLIEIDGTGVATNVPLNINSAAPTTIRGLVMNGWNGPAIQTAGGSVGAVITGNFLGTDPSGTLARPNSMGIQVTGVSSIIGGPAPADRNLISGNSHGIYVLNNGATIQGNLLGTDATGMLAIANTDTAIVCANFGGAGTLIGGTAAGEGNVVSGNLRGIWISQGSVVDVVYGNKIGVNAAGTGPLGNSDGIFTNVGGNDSLIGGTGPGEANEIAYNFGQGVFFSPNGGSNNAARGNSVHDNGNLGIDLGEKGPNFNDALDVDNGGNRLQNFPIVRSVEHPTALGAAETRVVGKLDSAASTTYDLDFYANPACSHFPREFIEGETWLGTTQVTTDASGHVDIDVTLPVATEAGARIAVTATDPDGNTSEFSQRIIFSISPVSGPDTGGTPFTASGTDFADPTTITVGGVPATGVTFTNDHTLNAVMPAFAPGTSQDVVATTPDGTTGTLVKGWVSDFLDVPAAHGFHSFVVTLVSNGITAGIGAGLYGVDQGTKRQQMAVFLLKAEHGLCYVPPPCANRFPDVACPSTFADWIEALAQEGITTGCGGGFFCPDNPVTRRQMAVFLLKTKYGSSYLPPPCTGVFGDVACPAGAAVDFIEQLSVEGITGGCQASPALYCPDNSSTRGQMAVFITKTFGLQ